MASGMLPLCFGQATNACGVLLGSAKAYRARLQLGAATDTGDAEGQVVRTASVPGLDRPQVAAVLASMVGKREQRPPMYSALKHQGRPLYELARRGEEVERAPRPVVVHRMELLELHDDRLEFVAVQRHQRGHGGGGVVNGESTVVDAAVLLLLGQQPGKSLFDVGRQGGVAIKVRSADCGVECERGDGGKLAVLIPVPIGRLLGLEPVVVLNKTPGYIAYLEKGMKL
jgi:hypothetical protein